MKVVDYDYVLPEELIAQYPLEQRTDSRLLVIDGDNQLHDRSIQGMLDLLQPNDLLVLNDTKVIPARLFGQKDTGGKIEILLERIIDENTVLAQIRASRSPKIGQHISVDNDVTQITVIDREGMFFKLSLSPEQGLYQWFEEVGRIPLPPYIDRDQEIDDFDRYQTVFADQYGAVAAPTAGLHYDDELLAAIKNKGVQTTTVTLHVGAGTYQPVKVDNIEEHQMHSERIEVNQQVCQQIIACKASGGRVVAVGTTVVRSLETAAQHSSEQLIEPYQGETDIFIYPGFEFKVVDCLQTNFHLPQSTLLMLVSALKDRQTILSAYQHAIEEQYRFFSYGDAMFIEC